MSTSAAREATQREATAGALPNGSALWHGVFAPLNLAAYAILGLLAFNQLVANDHGALRPWLALSWLLFVVGWVGDELVGTHRPGSRWCAVFIALEMLAAIANLALVYDGMNPILLVLIAAQLPALVSLPSTMAVLAALDGIAYLLLRDVHEQSRPLFNIAVFATFQAFAMLTVWFAHRAERANRELAAVNAHLLATRSLLEEGARDGERLRLSRELHDVAGHALTALKLHLELALRVPDGDERRRRVQAAHGVAESLLDDIRGVVGQLRRYDGIDLPVALATLCRGFPGVEVRLDVAPDLRVTDVDRAETLLRAVQEALTNAVRHGRARRIDVSLRRAGERVRAEIVDDGRGGDAPRFGNGLTGMQERLARHGGRLALDGAGDRGMRLTAELIDPEPDPA